MKEELCAWYQGFDYEEGFGPSEVLPSQWKKKHIDTYTLISAPVHVERQEIFGEDEDPGTPFFLQA